jgi:hypothetical protein
MAAARRARCAAISEVKGHEYRIEYVGNVSGLPPIGAELAHRSNNGRAKRSQPRGNANQFGRQLAKAVAGKEPMVYAVTEN